ncbi:SDR family oxidoreductase [Flaviaesturariibacter terrae]
MKHIPKYLPGKVVVITGASSGVGRAAAVALAAQGARVVLASRNRSELEALQRELAEGRCKSIVVPTDTRDPEQQRALADAARRAFGRIDAWINNAGVLAAGALEDVPAPVNEAVIRTNLLGYIHGAQAVLPIFKHQGEGILINNISVGAWLPAPYMAAYCASKFGLRGFSEALRGELGAYPRIHICDLFPGFLDTPGMQHAANYTGKELRPAPPLYDPREVATAIVDTIHNPRRVQAFGVVPHLLHIAYTLFPHLTGRITGALIRQYLKRADATVHTAGNVLEPVPYGNAIDGGWRASARLPKPRAKTVALGTLALVAAGLLLSRR